MSDEQVKTMGYDELEAQWFPLMHRFAKWRTGEYEDNLQEMRVTLWQCQEKFDPSKGVSFMTYVYRACLSKIMKIRGYNECVRKRVPPSALTSLELKSRQADASEYSANHAFMSRDEYGIVELLFDVSPLGKRVAKLVAGGAGPTEIVRHHGISRRDVNIAMRELRTKLRRVREVTNGIQ